MEGGNRRRCTNVKTGVDHCNNDCTEKLATNTDNLRCTACRWYIRIASYLSSMYLLSFLDQRVVEGREVLDRSDLPVAA